MIMTELRALIRRLPKAELHLHIEGSLEPEIFFDPQTHVSHGVPLSDVFAGIGGALREARAEHGFSSRMILCFLRHLSEAEAFATLDAALALRAEYADLWIGVGLDSSEVGHPPEKFTRVFGRARELGFRVTIHAGEEGPPEYVRGALDALKAERIDHGVRGEQDGALMERLLRTRTPLTMCPLSNLKLRVVEDLRRHNLARLLRAGLCVTINSDDPSYFGGYLNANFIAAAEALELSREEIVTLARNGFLAAFVTQAERRPWLDEIDAVAAQ
jgi:adenosine deaminase